jgi:hypothetical protein
VRIVVHQVKRSGRRKLIGRFLADCAAGHTWFLRVRASVGHVMIPIACKLGALVRRFDRVVRVRSASRDRLWLRPSGDGWSLLDCDGGVLFRGPGRSGRRHCLEFASSHGVLAVLS